jgi:hypothetical protein
MCHRGKSLRLSNNSLTCLPHLQRKAKQRCQKSMRSNSSADIITSSTTPPVVMDVPVAIVGSPSTLVEALEWQVIGIMVSFKVKSPDIATLEVGLKEAALV